ncbi:protein-L-isoaspartate(D-aspartate) O-methyltransferase [Candidatus Micrarchaeota archaeon]|nr:protein-L-isoaspartate(D-aspartate) O-methyltransferase [Candidatus Micrarchaeota archaeon]
MGNESMVDYLLSFGWITSESVKRAFLEVDRKYFIPKNFQSDAYSDNAYPIGSGQTISAPSVIAHMLEKLYLNGGMNVLEIGTGSGYNTALISSIVGKKGKVVTVERIKELSSLAENNIKNSGLDAGNIELAVGDGTEGYFESSPYDRVIVTGGIPYIKKEMPLVKQMKEDGILVAPVGERFYQNINVFFKKDGRIVKTLPVLFVPIIGKYGFSEK